MTIDAYLCPPAVLLSPGPQYTDQTRKFQGIPGIERAASGRLWATWYGGVGVTEDRYNHVLVATSGDDGSTWSEVRLVIDPDGDGPVRAFDPCLWHDPDGRLWLFWAQGYERHTDERSGVWAMVARQSDAEHPVWSDPVRICDGVMINIYDYDRRGAKEILMARFGEDDVVQRTVQTDRAARRVLVNKATGDNLPSSPGGVDARTGTGS